MKKKIFSLVLGICVSIVSLMSLTSCSLVKLDNEKINSEVVVKIGNTELTKKDIKSAFSTYYQNNSSYFSYYSNEVIEESFYQWAIVRQMLNDKSYNALYDATANPNGFIYYTEEDAKEVWKNVQDYVYAQVTSYEKSLYEADTSILADDYPSWVKDAEEEAAKKLFASYEKVEFDIDEDRKNNVSVKLTDEQVKAKLQEVIDYLFEYAVEPEEDADEDAEEVRKEMEPDFFAKRNQAYTNYIASLVSVAKANGTSTDKKVCLENDIVSIYKAYYNSKITSLYQGYYLNEYMSNYKGNGDADALSDATLVKTFIEAYYMQKQQNNSEANYITSITNKEGAPLVLYSYDGEECFFSVQHILVKFTDELTKEVKALEGYSTSNDYDDVIAGLYKENRDKIAEDNKLAMLTPVNEDNEFKAIEIFADYYYFDKDLVEEYDETKEIYNGYVKLIKIDDENFENYYDKTITYDPEKVTRMANLEDVMTAYDYNFTKWSKLVTDYFNGTITRESDELKDLEDFVYVLDTVDNMKAANATIETILDKVASYLFIELQWIYSSDSLGNELSNKIGYIISNYDDQNGSWVADFANGSRELVDMIEEGVVDIDAILAGAQGASSMLNVIVSDYGYHIIKVENIYEVGSSIGGIDKVIEDYLAVEGNEVDFEDEDFVELIVNFMKATYVCKGSNQTVYDYYFDTLYAKYVGTSESSGTYFIAIEYGWLSDYTKNEKIQFVNKLGLEELMESVA